MTSVAAASDLQALEKELLGGIAGAGDLAAIEQVRIAVLGKKGRIAELMALAQHAGVSKLSFITLAK